VPGRLAWPGLTCSRAPILRPQQANNGFLAQREEYWASFRTRERAMPLKVRGRRGYTETLPVIQARSGMIYT
jgi:hypothetical protein